MRPHTMLGSRFVMLALGLFALNFVWEMAQASFYSSMKGLLFWHATGLCARAAVADVALLALCFAIAALVGRNAAWPLRPTPGATTTFFASCLLVTIGIERWAIATSRWSYGNDMPLIFGVGALPLLQWILIPVLSVFAFQLAAGAMIRSSDKGGGVRGGHT